MYVQQSWSLTAFDRKKLFQWSHLREYARASLSTALRNMVTCSPVESIHFSILLVYWYRFCFKIGYLSAFSYNFCCVFFQMSTFFCKIKRLTSAWSHFAKARDEALLVGLKPPKPPMATGLLVLWKNIEKQYGRLVWRHPSFRGGECSQSIYKICAFLGYSNHKQLFEVFLLP